MPPPPRNTDSFGFYFYFLSLLNSLQNSNSYNFSAPIYYLVLFYIKDLIKKFCSFKCVYGGGENKNDHEIKGRDKSLQKTLQAYTK